MVLLATAAALYGPPTALSAPVTWHSATASWYGPGLWGNPLGCGGTLERGDIGVAHKSLPCGAKVRLLFRHRRITVRVIDRGPYSGSRSFDLTQATSERLRYVTDAKLLWRRVK